MIGKINHASQRHVGVLRLEKSEQCPTEHAWCICASHRHIFWLKKEFYIHDLWWRYPRSGSMWCPRQLAPLAEPTTKWHLGPGDHTTHCPFWNHFYLVKNYVDWSFVLWTHRASNSISDSYNVLHCMHVRLQILFASAVEKYLKDVRK